MAMWSLQMADRVLLAVLVTTSAVGIYSLASNAATALLVLLIGINQAFMPAYAQAGKLGSSTTNLHSIIKIQVAIISLLSLACAVLAPVAINVFLDARYRPAAGLTPWIVLGYGFIGLYSIPMNGVSLTHGRSRRIWVVSIAAAATNLSLIYAFVPLIGLEAAAIASAVGYGVLLLGVCLYSVQTRSTISYPWKSMWAVFTVTTPVYAGAVLTVGTTHLSDLLFRLLWVLAAAVGIWLIVDRRSLARLRNKIASRNLDYELDSTHSSTMGATHNKIIEDPVVRGVQTGPDSEAGLDSSETRQPCRSGRDFEVV
jgi:O-antigen/teichoic acid export membrane protein